MGWKLLSRAGGGAGEGALGEASHIPVIPPDYL